jgi:hypothetical protein
VGSEGRSSLSLFVCGWTQLLRASRPSRGGCQMLLFFFFK